MTILKYPNLFRPITIRGQMFRNRIFASPTGYRNIYAAGQLNDRATAYYERKAMGGAASVTTCQIMVDSKFGKGMETHYSADNPMIKFMLSRIAHGITSYGAVASMELQHVGMFANREISMYGGDSTGIAYGPVDMEMKDRVVKAMDYSMIKRTIDKYGNAAALAKRCGFGMVTIHGGHGWLLHQFMSPITNTRNDEWGGYSAENRMRLTKEILKKVRSVVGGGFPIEIRISASECYDGGYDIDTGVEIAKHLEGYVDLINVSAGNHEVDEVFTVTHPSMFLPEGVLTQFAAKVKKNVSVPVAAIGGLSDPDLMEDIIASGKADVIECARELLAEPDFPNKVRAGKEEDVRKCLRCLSCFSSLMSNGMSYCSINPRLGFDKEVRFAMPSPSKKKILIVGGGIAGMQASLSAVSRGHDVTLCEKSNRLGGVLLCEEKVSFKKNLSYYISQQQRFIEERGVNIIRNTTVDSEFISSFSPDVLIVAIGSRAIVPKIDGIDAPYVMSAEDAYIADSTLGENITIIGAGLVGAEIALHLQEHGRNVTILEASDHMADGGNFLHMTAIKSEISKRGINVIFNAFIDKISNHNVYYRIIQQECVGIADNIIYATGRSALASEASEWYKFAPEFHLIGDCVKPSNMTNAIQQAYFTIRNIK